MKVLITGGRDYADRELVFIVLDRIHRETPIALVIHGACGWDRDRVNSVLEMCGADRWADEWANERKVLVERVPAAWSKFGRSAGPRRNGEMVAMKPDMVLAFPGGAGTANCVRQARAARIVVEPAARTSREALALGRQLRLF